MSSPEDDPARGLAEAYAGMEGEFTSAEALRKYRSSLWDLTRPQAAFIAARAGGDLLEIGCGNGRLPISLRSDDVIRSAFGLDLAESRIAFAQQWAADEGLDGLRFSTGDALTAALGSDFSIGACITGAFAYFDAYDSGSGLHLLRRMRAALRDGALLVLELYQHPQELALLNAVSGPVRTWRELPHSDPWRYYLSEYSVDGSILTHRKAFVHRTSGGIDTGRIERLAVYQPTELAQLCRQAGFSDPQAWEGWTDEAYDGSDVLVLTATAG